MSNCDIPIENSCAVSSFDIVDTVGYRGSVNYIVSNISKYNGLIFVRFSDVDENYRPWKIIVDGKKYRHNDDRLLTALKRGNMAEFHVVNPKSKEQRVVEYSLIGFTAAYRKAQKSN